MVQWQDTIGDWQNVEGWQGNVTDYWRWWVHPKDFGTGPFRWVIFKASDGATIGSSELFTLPSFPTRPCGLK